MKRFKLLSMLLIMMLAGSRAYAYDIYSAMISINNNLSSGGYISVTLPFYDDDGLDEALAADATSKISINGTPIVRMWALSKKNSAQSTGNSYWCGIVGAFSGMQAEIYDEQEAKYVPVNDYLSKTMTYRKETSTTAFARINIYPSKEMLASGSLRVNVYLHVDKINSDFYDVERTQYINYTPPTFSPPTFMLAGETPGYQTMTFFGKKAGDSYSFIDPSTSEEVNGTVTSDNQMISYDIPVDNNPRQIELTNHVKVSPYTTYDVKTTGTIPAYYMPSTFTAEQTSKCNVLLKWTIDADTYDRNYQDVNGNWEVQRADNPQFDNPVTVCNMELGVKLTVDRTYTCTDLTSESNLNGKFYYRIRRTGNVWQWNENAYKTCDIDLVMNHRYVESANASIRDGKVTVSWDWDNGSIWSDGSKVYFERTNVTKSQTSSPEELTAKQISDRSFDDTLPTVLEEYTYRIYVEPGNTKYAKQTPLAVTSSVPLINQVMGHVDTLTASKGYYNDCVDLRWTTDGNTVEFFTVLARVSGSSSDFEQIASVEANNASVSYLYSDTRAVPGIIYEYLVRSNVKCNNQPICEEGKTDIGFRRPTGEINGRIAFADGQSEQDVVITAEPAEESTASGMAISLGENGYLKVTDESLLHDDTEFTFQAWVNPSSHDGIIAEKPNLFTLGIADNHLYMTIGAQTITCEEGVDMIADAQTNFLHVSAVGAQDYIALYVNAREIGRQDRVFTNISPSGSLVMGRGLIGVIDEVRVWTIPLTPEIIERDYDRYLVGNETGLAAYYTFDLSTEEQFFDLSYHGMDYNEKHGEIYNAVSQSESVPSNRQLGYRGISNSDGTYAIRSIPFSGNGLSYLIVPQKGNHSFSPVKELRYISPSSTVHTVNFTDNSSFKVTGYVTFNGGTVPVEGVQFMVNGAACSDGKGRTIKSDSKGYFEIQVPVGIHEVRAVMDGHVFENDGRLTNADGTDRNYQDILTGVEIVDQTLIKYVGRLAGGAKQEGLPIGFGVSTNNLGSTTSVKLRYQNDAYTLASEEHTETEGLYRDGNDAEALQNLVKFKDNEITIYPNDQTGEFVAWIPPVKYAITVDAPGYETYVKSLGQEKDFTSYVNPQEEVYKFTETVGEGDEQVQVKHEETLFYNVRQNFSVRVAPEIEVKQYRNSAQKYFGELEAAITDDNGDPATLVLYDEDEDSYVLGRPVFSRGVNYKLGASVHEVYQYRDALGAVVEGRKADKVPSSGAVVEFTCGADAPKRVEADTLGVAYHTFVLNEVNINNPVASVSVKAKVGDEGTFFPWTDSAPLTNFIVTGSKRKGTSAVTSGPDNLLTVLRDPPGSNSYSFIEEGVSFTRRETVQNVGVASTDQSWLKKLGHLEVGLVVVDDHHEIGGGISDSTKHGGSNTWTSKYSFSQGFQTSSDPVWVGNPADLYIGHSTNITYGTCDMVMIISEQNYQDVCAHSSSTFKTYDDITPSGSPYRLVTREGIDMQIGANTTFAYTQHHIETVVIPGLLKLRNSLLHQSSELSDSEALALAASQNEVVYVSKLDPSDPDYGKSEDQPISKSDRMFEYRNYKMFLPKMETLYSDEVRYYNESVRLWQERIADNEKAKLMAKLVDNYSFQGGGSRVSVSESYSYAHYVGYVWAVGVVGSFNNDNKAEVGGSGAAFSFHMKIVEQNNGEKGSTEEHTAKKGFVLADNNPNDYFSVDVLREQIDDMPVTDADDLQWEMPNEGYKPAFVFRTKGGASSCPYEGRRDTKYYNPGTELDVATLQIEGPQIIIDNPFIDNVPSGEAAPIVLKLANNSDADCTVKFKLKEVEKTNPNGLEMTIDGSALSGGYTIVIPAGQIITKTLLCRKAAVLNYDDIGLKLASDYVGLGVQPEIEAKAYFSVHFVPGASAVNIAKPASSWTYNTNLPTREIDGISRHYMDIELDGFDTNYDNFNCLRLQYKPQSASDEQWITLRSYYADEALYNEALRDNKDAYLITPADNGRLSYQWFMDDMMDQNYELRAVGVSRINNVEYYNASAVRSGIKDMYNPRLFGQPQPANGILGVEDEIRLNFNEPIAEGYLTRNNFSVTGVRNGAVTDHSVSVEIQNPEQALTSTFTRNLASKDVTVEMWIKPDAAGSATWFDYGDEGGLSFGITADSKLSVTNGEWTATGTEAVDFNAQEWAHVALVYDKEGNVDAYYNFVNALSTADAPTLPSDGKYRFGGNFRGNLHNARIWTAPVRAVNLKSNSLLQLSGREKDLMAYYPMNEGRGQVITDRAHSANIDLNGAQWTLPAGRAVQFGGDSYATIPTAATVADSSMDFTVEMWFKGDPSNANAALLSNGTGEGDTEFFLGFEEGTLCYANNGNKYEATGNWLDNAWHHVAVAVSRINGRGQICVDGKLNAYFPTESVGGFGAPFAALGARVNRTDAVTYSVDNHFTGSLDEVRLWNVYRNEDMLSEGCNVQLAGDETGLMAYYPFEKYIEHQGVKELTFSLADARQTAEDGETTPVAELVNTLEASAATTACAPVKGSGEVSKLQYDFVVNNDAIIINLNEDLNRVENTIVTFSVDGVRDLNGNKILNPICWSAYVQRNQLGWSQESVDLSIREGESAGFSVEVINSGGRNLTYTISNLPSWLKVSASSGKAAPTEHVAVDFTVTDAVPIGSYTEYIYLTGDNDVTETLVLNLKVNGQKPDWSLNPADFDYSMNMVGKLKIDGTYSTDTEDIVAVFNGGECVGLANNSYVEQNDSYEVLLTIYSNVSASRSKLDFYVWDASTGRTWVLTPDVDVTFSQNTVVGSIDAPVLLQADGRMVQYIPLESGWNWVSIAVEDPALSDLPKALSGYDWSSGDIVKSESEALVSYHNDGYWIGSLPSLSTANMYHVYAEQPLTLHFGGQAVTGASLEVLGAGEQGARWTYLPYWPSVKLPVDEAMAGYEASVGDILKGQTKFAVYSDNLGWVGNLTAMEPGKGYMLCRKASDNGTLTYNTVASTPSALPAAEYGESAKYAANMTMVATLKGVDGRSGDRLVALVNGEERGWAQASGIVFDGSHLFFLTISGDESDMVDFVLERDGSTDKVRVNAVDYVPNNAYGTAEVPFVIDFEHVNGSRVYPTMVTDLMNVDVTADENARGCVEVFDINGVSMYTQVLNSADGTTHLEVKAGSWQSGVYFVIVTVDGRREAFKIFKE